MRYKVSNKKISYMTVKNISEKEKTISEQIKIISVRVRIVT